MTFMGRAWKFGDDINTDEIIPARYLSLTDPVKLAEHVMEDADPEFPSKVGQGDIIIAGKNFGCGSSRETCSGGDKSRGGSLCDSQEFCPNLFPQLIQHGASYLGIFHRGGGYEGR